MRAEETSGFDPAPLECVVQVEIVLGEDEGLTKLVWTEVIPTTTVHLLGHPAWPAHLSRPYLPWRRPGEW